VTVIDFTAFIGRLATAAGETILPFFRTSLSIDKRARAISIRSPRLTAPPRR
jgi:myo-inositol-1(or 4)-monophosphatase